MYYNFKTSTMCADKKAAGRKKAAATESHILDGTAQTSVYWGM